MILNVGKPLKKYYFNKKNNERREDRWVGIIVFSHFVFPLLMEHVTQYDTLWL
jgi:hypothetical protein